MAGGTLVVGREQTEGFPARKGGARGARALRTLKTRVRMELGGLKVLWCSNGCGRASRVAMFFPPTKNAEKFPEIRNPSRRTDAALS